jgi:hypothetical protein
MRSPCRRLNHEVRCGLGGRRIHSDKVYREAQLATSGPHLKPMSPARGKALHLGRHRSEMPGYVGFLHWGPFDTSRGGVYLPSLAGTGFYSSRPVAHLRLGDLPARLALCRSRCSPKCCKIHSVHSCTVCLNFSNDGIISLSPLHWRRPQRRQPATKTSLCIVEAAMPCAGLTPPGSKGAALATPHFNHRPAV